MAKADREEKARKAERIAERFEGVAEHWSSAEGIAQCGRALSALQALDAWRTASQYRERAKRYRQGW
jgi:hypothetical protein